MSVYVGADIHKTSTTLVVLDGEGKMVSQMVTRTTEESLKMFVQALPGPVNLTFEESSYASWLWDVLNPYVAKLVVCDPRKNPQIKANKKKSDQNDARLLAEALRTNSLTPVYHGEGSKHDLKELIKSYDQLVADRTKTKNRINALFSSRGIRAGQKGYYVGDWDVRQSLIDQLSGSGMQMRMQALYTELDGQDGLVKQLKKAMLVESRKFDEVKRIQTVPGFGPIRSAQFVGWLQTPHRFRTKKQLFSYIGLGIVTRGSAEWVESNVGLRRDATKIQTRGLNNQCHRALKAVIKGAAKDACTQHASWKRHHDVLVEEGKEREMVRLTIARKLASTALSLWKNGGKYSDEQAVLRS